MFLVWRLCQTDQSGIDVGSQAGIAFTCGAIARTEYFDLVVIGQFHPDQAEGGIHDLDRIRIAIDEDKVLALVDDHEAGGREGAADLYPGDSSIFRLD